MRYGSIRLAAALVAAMALMAPAAHASVVFDNQNGLSVSFNPAGPPVATTFTLASLKYITLIDIYHYGDPISTDTIGLLDSGNNVVGTWATTIGNPLPYLHLVVNPNIFLGPGTYTIIDGRPDAWAFNAASGNRGFATVLDGPPPEEPAPEPATLALLGAGLTGLGALRRRKRA